MKKWMTILLTLFAIHYSPFTYSQEIPLSTEQQLENQTDADQGETEDDTYLQDLDHFKKNPLNLNTADAEELKQLRIITDLQIANLITYRNLFGKLISIYELQAVPAWDVNTIRKLLPFITAATPVSLKEEAGKRFGDGDHSLLVRVTQVLERSDGFDKTTSGTKYLGSPQRIFFRYRYTYKNLLQFGLVGDKDAGEQFLKGAQNKGFDFYSFHLFARKIGIIQSLAVGDFSVNMGQGLIQWQGLAFKKSVDVMGVKRQSAVLRPYSSAGEFYFHRGAGITIRKGRIESTVFVSFRKLGGNFVADTVNNEDFVSSFLTSGYHRTPSEIADRNNLLQTAFGGNIIYRGNRWHLGLNGIYYKFSLPIEKRNEPYNLYAISGDHWFNFSLDYSYTYKNLHFFGEAAADKRFNKAFVNGLLLSVDPRVDISVVQRTIHKAYQSINGNAFTENTYPTNETGFYAGIAIRPAIGWRVDLYGDIYKFPWLKYLVDAPSHGRDFLVQLTYTPNRQAEMYTRFRNETKQSNQSDNTTVTNYLVSIPKQSWRTQVSYKISGPVTMRNRFELLWYDNKGVNKEKGFLGYADIIYKPLLKPLSATIRLQYFETDGYNSRIYAYENDVLYSYSIPAFFDQGFRYYLNLNYDLSKKISFWFRLAQTVYQNKNAVGSGLDEIPGNRRTELKAQVRWLL
ncbi:MAG TPA: helix-hairpin-helix domain-containing protein [Chitinophagaceae bacterium]|nr:helix-hairpin-helix domain-containing protein [Chitinophagaceae bacterium]